MIAMRKTALIRQAPVRSARVSMLVLFLVSLIFLGARTAAGAGVASRSSIQTSSGPPCPGQSQYNSGIGKLTPEQRPVVLVHGWGGSSTKMVPVAQALTGPGSSIASQIKVFYFDYRAESIHWAAIPAIASCLAEYVSGISAAYRAAGGDGKVIVVAHSMGGLAVRFASATNSGGQGVFTDEPIDKDLGGLVTIDTPSLGSPLGGSALGSGFLARILEDWNSKGLIFFPPSGTDGGECLALHAPPQNKIPGCATPPYLSPPFRVTQIAGDVTVSRSLFGIHLYDIPLASDGIVPLGSQQAYVTSGPGGRAPYGGYSSTATVSCTISLDNLLTLPLENIPPGNLSSILDDLSLGLFTDDQALQQAFSGKVGPALLSFLLAADELAPCSHPNMLTDSQSLEDVRSAVSEDLRELNAQDTSACSPTLLFAAAEAKEGFAVTPRWLCRYPTK